MYGCDAPLAGCIEYFTVDRAKLYDTVVKSIEEKYGVKITRLSKSPNLMRDIRLGSGNESMRRVWRIICGNGWR